MSKETWEKVWANQDKSKSMFDKVWWKLRHSFSKKYARIIARLIRGAERPKILEVGCGSALTFDYLRRGLEGPELVGLDYSANAVKIAKKMHPASKFVIGDARSLPFGNGQFDLAYSLGLIEHFSRKEAAKIVVEHARVTRKGGKVMIVVPAKYSFLHIARKIAGRHWPFGHEEAFSRNELYDMMVAAKIRHVTVRRLNTVVYVGVGSKG